MSREIILETRALTVGYLNKAVVSDISFQLHQGEILTLIGPNGAGKSTILKTITSELPCLSGEILLHGKQILFSDCIRNCKANCRPLYGTNLNRTHVLL